MTAAARWADVVIPTAAAAAAGVPALALALRGDKGVQRRTAALATEAAEKTSPAPVFIKPHAVTDEVKDLVRKQFAASGVHIVSAASPLPRRSIWIWCLIIWSICAKLV